ncbi:putative P-loop containing nucleoside triphosphate hydrolase [Septoria linicola]|nr:putative P-loop containing nucleoside triphosphate hydrolase [Septoria linicola]
MSNSHDEEASQRSQYATSAGVPSGIASSNNSSTHKRVGSTSPSTLRKIQPQSAPSRIGAPMASGKRQRSGESTMPAAQELDFGKCSLSGPRCGQPQMATLHRHSPWCHALVPQVERLTLEICDGFLKTVSNVGGRKHAALALKCRNIDQIKDLKLVYSESKPVALVGSMGAGKSQLTNALLGLSGAAITSDSTRGTNTILEFRAPKGDQTTKFILEIVCYSADQIKGQLWGYICKIHDYFQLRVQIADAGEDADFDPAELEEQRRHYSTACTILLTVLCGSDILGTQLQDLETFKSFLDTNIDGRARIDDPGLIELCNTICEAVTAFLELQGVSNDVKAFEVDDIDALEDAMYETIRPSISDESQQHLWPLVRKAVVHYDSKELLNMGVVIADMPGLQDTNETIVDNTSAYLAAAGTILLAAPVTRIAELTEIDEYLRRCIQLRKAKNIVLVATKADMLAKVLKPADRKKLSPQDDASIRSAEDEISAIEQELADREGEKSRLVEAEEWKAVHDYVVETPDLKSRMARAVRKRTRAVRQLTKTNLEAQLNGKLRDLSHSGHGPDLKVVFSSAQTLEQHIDGSGLSLTTMS